MICSAEALAGTITAFAWMGCRSTRVLAFLAVASIWVRRLVVVCMMRARRFSRAARKPVLCCSSSSRDASIALSNSRMPILRFLTK